MRPGRGPSAGASVPLEGGASPWEGVVHLPGHFLTLLGFYGGFSRPHGHLFCLQPRFPLEKWG